MTTDNLFLQILRDQRGTSSVEMGLICAMIVLAMFAALDGFSTESVQLWTTIKDRTVEATGGTSS